MEPIFSNQLTFASPFSTQPPPLPSTVPQSEPITAPVSLEKTQAWNNIVTEIEGKQDKILELEREIGDSGDAGRNAEEEDYDTEPEEGEEVIFDKGAPDLDEDFRYTRYGCESEIETLKDEVTKLEGELELMK